MKKPRDIREAIGIAGWVMRGAIESLMMVYLISSKVFLACLIGFAGSAHPAEDLPDYRVPTSINEYFNYLSSETRHQDDLLDSHIALPWQLALISQGYNIGSCGADGDYGTKTRAALRAFQRDQNLGRGPDIKPQTFQKLADEAMSHSYSRTYLDNLLLKPYQQPAVKSYLAALPEEFDWKKNLIMGVRPDVEYTAWLESRNLREKRASAREEFPDCTQNHLRNVFYHAERSVSLNQRVGPNHARRIGDYTERVKGAPLTVLLSDLYNRRAVLGLDPSAVNTDSTSSFRGKRQVIIEAIESDQLLQYPFPLVPAGFNSGPSSGSF